MKKLQEEIERIARNKLNRDIKELSERHKEILNGSLGSGVAIKILDDDGKSSYPYLSQLFDCEAVRNKIIERNLPDYVEREVNAILFPKTKSNQSEE